MVNDSTLFEKHFVFGEQNGLGMYYSGKRVNTPNHYYGPEIRNHFLLVYVNNGSAVFHSTSGDISFGTNDLLIMFPDERIYYTVNEGVLWNIQWVGVYGNQSSELIERLGVTRKYPFLHITFSKGIEITLDRIYNSMDDTSFSGKLKSISLLYEFFSYLFKNKDLNAKTNIITDVKNIIMYNYDKSPTIEYIAKVLHVNPTYLARIFKEETGLTPKEYILQEKISRAKNLLKKTDASISEISYSSGFSDPLYFSRLFSKKVGKSPSAWRKEAIETKI